MPDDLERIDAAIAEKAWELEDLCAERREIEESIADCEREQLALDE